MGQIGQKLREARNAKGLSLEDLQKTTKIRMRYLEALEGEDWAIFPGQVYLKGFLKGYAQALDLDAQELLLWYQTATLAQAEETESEEKRLTATSVNPRRSTALPTTRPVVRRISPAYQPLRSVNGPRWGYWIASCGLVVVFACSWLVFSAYRAGGQGSRPPAANPNPAANAAPSTPPAQAATQTTTTPPSAQTPLAPVLELTKMTDNPQRPFEIRYVVKGAPKLDLKVQVRMAPATEAEYRCWVEVQTDDQNLGNAVMISGKSNTFAGNDTIKVRLGNPRVADVTINGMAVPQPATPDAIDLVFIRQP